MSAIPQELRSRPQWVNWRREERGGEPTKVPYRSDGAGRASTTDASTWSSYAAALDAALFYDGVGFVFSAFDPFVGVDLDDCLIGNVLHEGAAEIVRSLSSYTEVSPSETGLKIVARASKGANTRCRTSKTPWGGMLEIYDQNRFFALTGKTSHGSVLMLDDRQERVDALLAQYLPPEPEPAQLRTSSQPVDLDDQVLLELAMSAKNGINFRELWEGSWQDSYPSQSEADLALCGRLSFWTRQDAPRIDRMFRASGLMRPKWDSPRRHGETTYGAETIRAAISRTDAVYRGRS